jgi:RNA polymerase sigma-70 factor, ECF subfamily
VSGRVLRIRRQEVEREAWSDEAVAHACASGDPVAVAELFERYHSVVIRFLSCAVGPGPDVEDLLQTTFMEVATVKSPFRGRSTVLTWLLGIAANVARHHLRSRHRRARLLRAVSLATRRRPMPSVDETTDARRAIDRASEVLRRLPDDKRLAFVLCEFEGLGAKEAAEVLGCSETAIWKRVSEARHVLRKALSAEVER